MRLYYHVILICLFNVIGGDAYFDVILLHLNDIFGQDQETKGSRFQCAQEQGDGETNRQRSHTTVSRLKVTLENVKKNVEKSDIPLLCLHTGDVFEPYPFNLLEWEGTANVVGNIGIDVTSIGSDDFQAGIEILSAYLNRANVQAVASNINSTIAQKIPHLSPSKTFQIHGQQIAIVGYTTPKVVIGVQNTIFSDEIAAIRKEVNRLKGQGVSIIIALGDHSSPKRDVEIAREISDVSLVISGGSLTKNIENATGKYPIMVKRKSGAAVPVFRADGTDRLSMVNVRFSDSGQVISANGNSILLDEIAKQDDRMLGMFWKYEDKIRRKAETSVGITKVCLNSELSKRTLESNLGNLISDSFIHYMTRKHASRLDGWTDAPVAVIQNGDVKSRLASDKEGIITYGDVARTVRFNDQLYIAKLNGSIIKKILENSVDTFVSSNYTNYNHVLQHSGLQVIYNLSEIIGKRVKGVTIRCGQCLIPQYFDVIQDRKYNVVLTDPLIHKVEDTMHDEPVVVQSTGVTVGETVLEYLQYKRPLYPGIEGRIVITAPFIEQQLEANSRYALTITLTVFILGLVIAIFFLFYKFTLKRRLGYRSL